MNAITVDAEDLSKMTMYSVTQIRSDFNKVKKFFDQVGGDIVKIADDLYVVKMKSAG